ncbi:uncharacterized protein PHACADRAFT_207772 [Phanerochaete carnosa HHB-10118-sp]|uniref:Uncharacterized protein n=1 Tax=Phanerochaete carnosa (strain HHB-10118-sp) TaxID=650164 RepID=K5X1A7_PHACS|nr:uncharacterized protein PHACADRAFT_207772 [Phanerochaete carnosa HHB-10118-sp]EKM56552.1 hypothetical protein PHACADRAFT_207772 [Phanerochaete carnosa HHB-10118-sp]
MSGNGSPSGVRDIARKQLEPGFAAAHPLSFKAYCKELEKHISLYPHDINFRVTLKPGRDLGATTCLEAGCGNAQTPLIENISSPKRGRELGVGSLSAYRAHIASSVAHRDARDARVRSGHVGTKLEVDNVDSHSTPNSAPHMPDSRRPALLDGLDGRTPGTLSSAPHAGTGTARARQLLARSSSVSHSSPVKSEPMDTVIPRKRSSDVPSRDIKKEGPLTETLPTLSTPAAKRLKSETYSSPKTPLGLANRAPSFSDLITGHSFEAAMNDDDIAEVRRKIGEIQSQMSSAQAMHDKAQRKPNKSKADTARIDRLKKHVDELTSQKARYAAMIPTVSPSPRKPTIPRYHTQSAPSGSDVQLPPAFYNPTFYNPGSQNGALQNQAFHNLAFDQQNLFVSSALWDSHPAIASGSNVKVEVQTHAVKPELNDPDLAFDFQKINAGIPGMRAPVSDDERFDDDGDFYGRGKDMFAGPIAKADDIEKFLVSAGNAEQFDSNASVEKALVKLGLPALYHPLPGMEVALMPHQAIGVAWMLEKEKSHAKGGCMADEMGLGKTVQMIAVVARNRSQDPLKKTTLIIAPLALLDQWQLEIDMKTNVGFQCLIYHGNNKPRNPQELRKYDVVLTTFQTLAHEWPDDEAEEKEKAKKKRKKVKMDGFIVDDSEDEKPLKRKGRKTDGPLMLVEWYRVVLDEAQNVRNRRTRVSRAVSKLQATYRWCLTGTPIINGLADAYGLLRFLQYRPWYDWSEFNSHISRLEKKRPELATQRLQAIFAAMLLRRKKDSLLDGKRLIELPTKEVVLQMLEFTKEEREIYQMARRAIFNKFLRAGTVLKNYHQVLVLLLRLRQICSHPSLIQEEGVAFVANDDEETGAKYTELVRAERIMGAEFVSRMQAKFKQAMLDRMAAEKASADATLEGDDFECPVCFDGYTDPIITACGHSFCRDCITNVLNGAQREDAAEPTRYKMDERPCPTCRSPISADKIFARTAFEPSDEQLSAEKEEPVETQIAGDTIMVDVKAEGGVKSAKAGRVVRKRRAHSRRVLDSDEDVDDDEMSDFIVESDEDEEKDARRELKKRLKGKRRAIVLSDDEDEDVIFGTKQGKPEAVAGEQPIRLMAKFLPSTKMKHMMELLKQCAQDHPDEKTLIVSQWTQCLQLVSNYLTENEIAHVKYQGNMNRAMRDRAVRAFMSKDKATVMLMSLKCGGVGLNLTRANWVINLDLGWSLAIEQQAYDRVHRLGQTRPVYVHRLVTSNTVEDRILALQERKKDLADGSLGEGTGKKLGRLSVKELANLFGLDHRGHLL